MSQKNPDTQEKHAGNAQEKKKPNKLGKLEKKSLPILPTLRPNKREAKREPKISKPKHGETVQNDNRQWILKESLRSSPKPKI